MSVKVALYQAQSGIDPEANARRLSDMIHASASAGWVTCTARCVQPESNHTSRMSVSLRNGPFAPHAEQVKPPGRKRSTGSSYHASDPCSRVSAAARSMTAGSSSASSHDPQ